MKPSDTHPPPDPSPVESHTNYDGWARRLLFEDDYEFFQVVVAVFRSGRTSGRVSQKAAFGVAIGIFLLTLGVMAEVGGKQDRSPGKNAGRGPDSTDVSMTGDGSIATPAANARSGTRSGSNAVNKSASVDRGSSVGSGPAGSVGNRSRAGGGIVVVKNGGGGAGSGAGSNGVGSGFGGGGPASQTGRPAEQPAAVPESGSSCLLLAGALALVFLGRHLLTARVSSSISR